MAVAGVVSVLLPIQAIAVVFLSAATIHLRHRGPELLLVGAALLVPSGHIVPVLRVPLASAYVTLSQALALLLGIMALLRLSNRRDALRSAPAIAGWALIVAGTTSAVGSSSPIAAMYWTIALGLALVALGAVLGPRLQSARRAVHLTLISIGGIVATITVLEATWNRALLNGFFIASLPGYQAGGAAFRPRALIGNALVLSAALVVVYALVLTTPYLSRLRLPLAMLFGLAIYFTLSRSSMGVLGLVTILYMISRRTAFRERLLMTVAGVPTLLYGFNVVLPKLVLRGQGESADIRELRILDAWELFRNNPLVGVGLGGYKRLGPEFIRQPNAPTTADNMYVTLLVELGLVGAVLLLFAAISVWRARRSGHSALPLLAVVVNGAFFEFLYHDATLVLFAIVLSDWSIGLKAPRPTKDREPRSSATNNIRTTKASRT